MPFPAATRDKQDRRGKKRASGGAQLCLQQELTTAAEPVWLGSPAGLRSPPALPQEPWQPQNPPGIPPGQHLRVRADVLHIGEADGGESISPAVSGEG